MVNLEALANDLRAAAEGFVLRDPDDALVVCSDSGDRLLIVEESGRCVLGGDVYELDDAIRLAPLFAIIARHLGGEGYVPVAPPDDRTVNCHVCGEYIGVRFGEVYTPGDDICATCIAELAALPARHAVPVVGGVTTDWLDPIRLGCYIVGMAVGFALGRWT